jgi:hypothetical protein
MTINNSIEIKWIIKDIEGFGFGSDKNLYNLKTCKRKKHTMNNYTKGYWIGRKFYTHNKLKELLIKPVKVECPF